MKKKKETKTMKINIRPTWIEALPLLLRSVRTDQKRNKEVVEYAYQELCRMAEAADKWNEYVDSIKK